MFVCLIELSSEQGLALIDFIFDLVSRLFFPFCLFYSKTVLLWNS